jgi:DNA-binding NarL/FixJ family response regulator
MKENNECLKLLSSHKNYIEIIFLISHGLANKNIADALNLSDRTVSVHRSAIFKIVGCKNSLELVGWAIEKKIKSDPNLLMKFNKTIFVDKKIYHEKEKHN